MAKINFYLKPGKINKKGEKSLIMRITYGSSRTVIFLGHMVHPKFWNNKKQICKESGTPEIDKELEFINEAITHAKEKARDAIINANKNNIVLCDAYFKSWFANKKTNTKFNASDFFGLFDAYLDSIRPDREAQTIKGYTTIRNFLQTFEEKTNYYISIGAIDHSFYDALKKYALTDCKIAHNYFAKIVSVLKSFLRWAEAHKIKVSDEYKNFSFAEKEKEVIFLTMDELMTLYNYKFESKRLNNARDIYCFGCFTGLRVSDILELKRDHIRGDNIHKTIKKTKQPAVIPLNKFAQAILKKHVNLSDRPLPKISAPKLNEYIKECCKKAEIDAPTSITKFYGGRAEEFIQPKHELITTHTARKTFLTNSIILGMNYMAAKGISGHKKDKDFNKYVKIAEDFKKTEMERTWGKFKNTKKRKKK